MKRKHLQSTPENGTFGIQTVYRNAGPGVKAGFLGEDFFGISAEQQVSPTDISMRR
jgi:hypothetical protein